MTEQAPTAAPPTPQATPTMPAEVSEVTNLDIFESLLPPAAATVEAPPAVPIAPAAYAPPPVAAPVAAAIAPALYAQPAPVAPAAIVPAADPVAAPVAPQPVAAEQEQPPVVLNDAQVEAYLANYETSAGVELDQIIAAANAPAPPAAEPYVAPNPWAPAPVAAAPAVAPLVAAAPEAALAAAQFEITDADFEAMAVDKGAMQRIFTAAIQQATYDSNSAILLNLPRIHKEMFDTSWDQYQAGEQFLAANPSAGQFPKATARALLRAKNKNPGAPLPVLLEAAKQELAFAMELATRAGAATQVTVASGEPGNFGPGVVGARHPDAAQPAPVGDGLDPTQRALAEILATTPASNLRNQPTQ